MKFTFFKVKKKEKKENLYNRLICHDTAKESIHMIEMSLKKKKEKNN